MTIAICLKVGDGVVLGADSASTLMTSSGVANVYFNAEKVINLRKGFPVGAVTYGLGGLSGRSITSLAKDLRTRLSPGGDWELTTTYTLAQIAARVREYFYEELYLSEYPPETQAEYPAMGFTIAGYSGGAAHPEVWNVEVDDRGRCPAPELVFDQALSGVVQWKGQPEALFRLLAGYSDAAHDRLIDAGLDPTDAMNLLMSWNPLATPGMPIQDAIDLVQYLAEVTVGYVRFSSGAPTVAPPIDLAAITKHEGFRWVRRKHYYAPELNAALVA
jgi:hypothetical protein